MKTFIRFVVFKDEILAVFMRKDAEIRYSGGYWVRSCYAHMGQHSDCYDGMQKRKRATVEQYQDLKHEMENIGYELEVI